MARLVFLARGGFRLQGGMHSKTPQNNLLYGKNDEQNPFPILPYQICRPQHTLMSSLMPTDMQQGWIKKHNI